MTKVRTLRALSIVLIVIVGAGFVIAVAFVAIWASTRDWGDWNRISAASQLIIAGSSALSVLSVAGAIWALLIQGASLRSQRELTVRTLHFDLSRLSIEDSTLDVAWGMPQTRERRVSVYLNLIFSHWELMFIMDMLGAAELKLVAEDIFEGLPARNFWSDARGFRKKRADLEKGKVKSFHEIIDEAFVLKAKTRPRVLPTNPSEERSRAASRSIAKTLLAAAAAVLVYHRIHAGRG